MIKLIWRWIIGDISLVYQREECNVGLTFIYVTFKQTKRSSDFEICDD